MKKLLVPTILGVLFLLTPVFAVATSLTGSIQGYNSVAQGQASHAGINVHIAAHVAATETAFVIVDDAAKGNHYLIRNVDRAVLARLVNQQVKIDGDLDRDTESIKAKNIYTTASGTSWQKVWAVDFKDDVYRDILGALPLEGRD